MKKVIASGYHNNTFVKIECIEDDEGVIFVYVNDRFNINFEKYLRNYTFKKWSKTYETNDSTIVFNPTPTSLEAYWLALNEISYFDTTPNIIVIGDLQLNGAPYDTPFKGSTNVIN